MKLDKYQIGIISFVLLVILFILIGGSIFKRKLIANHQVSIAKITDCYYGGRGNLGTTMLFSFYINGKKIQGTSSYNSEVLGLSDAKSFFLGKAFPVVYDPDHPNNNFILISPESFKKFNVSFPDSLQWVKKYVKDN